MISIRRSGQRGFANHGWLKSFHTFSFGSYQDPRHMGFGNLRVINEDRVLAGRGFGPHNHHDMEIVSYVLEGELAHRDSLGTGTDDGRPSGIIRPGDVQRMSAGTGVTHSEFNHSSDHGVHFLQIWLLPAREGLAPGYEQKHFDVASKRGRLRLIASNDGRDGSVTLHADAALWAGLFDGVEQGGLSLAPDRQAYVHLARGRLSVNGHRLEAGDAAALVKEPVLQLTDGHAAEVLVFDVVP
jgi:redox-sensitive bicupin YhaK (pirin superfamily)